jgi:hypothetical protein
MKLIRSTLYITLLLTTSIMAQAIKDVPNSDPSYDVINTAIKSGYLPLYSDNTFQSTQPVTRKEMALILDKLLSGDSNADLTKVQIQELLGLSKSFKSKSVQFDKIQTDLSAEQRRLDDEQKVINTDISRLSSELASTNMTIVEMKNNNAADASRNVEITALKKEIEDQRLSMWVAIGISIILGIIK